MTINLIEREVQGHQPYYVRACKLALEELGVPCVTIVPVDHPNYADYVSAKRSVVRRYPTLRTFSGRGGAFLTRTNRVLSEIRMVRSMRSANQKSRTLIYYPTMSGSDFRNCKCIFDMLKQQWGGLYISASELRRGYPKSYHREVITNLFASRKCSHIYTIDGGVIEQMRELLPAKVEFFPDVIGNHASSVDITVPKKLAEMYARNDVEVVITHAGLLTKRKGIMNFVNAIVSIKSNNVKFNIVGPVSLAEFSDDERKFIEDVWRRDPRVSVYREAISSELFQWVVQSSDIMFAVYHEWTQGSSVLTHASHAGIPTIVPDGSCMADLCRRFNLGWVINPNNCSDYSGVLNQYFDSKNSDSFGYEDHLELQSFGSVKTAMENLFA